MIDHLKPIVEAVQREYYIFQPQRISFFDVPGLAGFEQDNICFAATFDTIYHQQRPAEYDRIEVVRENTLDFYPEYSAIYDRLLAIRPDHPATCESRESLERCAKEGALFSIFVDGQWSGVFAARSDSDRYLDGYYVVEKVLHEAVRSKGMGVIMERKALEAIGAEPPMVLYGHIGSTNLPSQRSAVRNGRVPIYSSYWHNW